MLSSLTSTSLPQARTSLRYSAVSMAAPSLSQTIRASESAHAEIHNIALGLDRMENKALSSQRVVLTDEKTEKLGKLALGAKLERALDRRMSSQDAIMRPRKNSCTVDKSQLVEKAG